MHHGHAQMTHDQNSQPELFLRDVIIMMNKDVYIKRMSGTVRWCQSLEELSTYKSYVWAYAELTCLRRLLGY